ncbi:uncharacterized protein LOC127790739 [Diospyros lotus]|uniref:uncharacterized protein LOC127790739 n=1 Tax=Diospyros lotus TaxID=55363 RepID=UPI00224ECC03|nr:uncharacterized protein LOC127790739 [Diospyros lotus]
MASASTKQLLHQAFPKYSPLQFSPYLVVPYSLAFTTRYTANRLSKLVEFSGQRNLAAVSKASSGTGGTPPTDEDDDGVSLGTMKLPPDTDLPRFESLLFQWANSLCQGANLPLPVPLKVDKIPGGARLGFITIRDDGMTEVLVYIDCLVFPGTDGSAPLFRAVRNGSLRDQPAPGEPRIMRSLLQALKKSAEIARV